MIYTIAEGTVPINYFLAMNIKEIPAPDSIAAEGFCVKCNTVHTIRRGTAIDHCIAIMEKLRAEKRIDFDTPIEQADPLCSTDILYSRLGQMFGVLVCHDSADNEVVLKSFSYKHGGLVWDVPGWVPTLADPERYDATVEFGNSLIHPLTHKINLMEKNDPAREPLVEERKCHSHRIMDDLYNLYHAHNFCGEERLLEEIFHSDQPKMPMGTGDCCAPKLLNYAARQGLTPISMAEFYWGKSSHDGLRIEGEFYSACERRCQPILGFMLCGIE